MLPFLDCCIWVKFLNPLTQIIKSFLCKWCECIEVLAIKIFSKDNVVHPYAVIVVLTHTITQNPKVSQVHPVCRFVLDSAEQHSSCVEVVPAMVVVMQHQPPLIVYIEVFVFPIVFRPFFPKVGKQSQPYELVSILTSTIYVLSSRARIMREKHPLSTR